MFTPTRILTLASLGDLAESKADIEMTPLLFAGVRWLPVNCGRQVRTGLGITSLVGLTTNLPRRGFLFCVLVPSENYIRA